MVCANPLISEQSKKAWVEPYHGEPSWADWAVYQIPGGPEGIIALFAVKYDAERFAKELDWLMPPYEDAR